MHQEPNFTILPHRARRGQVRDWLGVSDEMFTKLVAAHVIVPHHFLGCGRAWFYREELLAAEREGRLERAPAAPRPTERTPRREEAKTRRRAA